jgi:chromosome segregation ATPase
MVDELNKRLGELTSQKKEGQQNLDELVNKLNNRKVDEEKVRQLKEELDRVNRDIEKENNEIEKLRRELEDLNNQIAQLENEI